MLAEVICLSVIPIALCACGFVYGLIGCIRCQIEGQEMGESKQYRKMFFLAVGSLTLLLLLPNPWVLFVT